MRPSTPLSNSWFPKALKKKNKVAILKKCSFELLKTVTQFYYAWDLLEVKDN